MSERQEPDADLELSRRVLEIVIDPWASPDQRVKESTPLMEQHPASFGV